MGESSLMDATMGVRGFDAYDDEWSRLAGEQWSYPRFAQIGRGVSAETITHATLRTLRRSCGAVGPACARAWVLSSNDAAILAASPCSAGLSAATPRLRAAP